MTQSPRGGLSLNQATIRRADLPLALDLAVRHGLPAIGLWREPVAAVGLADAVRRVSDSGLRVSSLCRGGFFTAAAPDAFAASLDDNRRALDEAAALAAAGAPGSAAVLALVVGGIDRAAGLAASLDRVRAALEALAPHAADVGVTLGLEPLHPMFASDRSVVTTLAQALDLVADLPPTIAGVVVDAFHVWWDPALEASVGRAGREGRIASVQISDWDAPLPPDVLLSRRMPGDGIIDLPGFLRLAADAGWEGDVEVEVFHQDVWDADPADVVARVAGLSYPPLAGSRER